MLYFQLHRCDSELSEKSRALVEMKQELSNYLFKCNQLEECVNGLTTDKSALELKVEMFKNDVAKLETEIEVW